MATPASAARPAFLLATTAVLALALALRLFQLDAQSLWYDEGSSVALAGRSFAQIAHDAARDIHPPLYYWLLAAWVRVVGDGVWAMRALSALVGTAVVGCVVGLGRRLFGTAVALAAGLLAATSPYLIWYSQELRMYSLAALWAGLLAFIALRLAEVAEWPGASRLGWTAAAALVATAALYTHYLGGSGGLVVGSVVVAVLVIDRWRQARVVPWSLVGLWAMALGTAALLFVPWLLQAWPSLRSWPAISAPVTPLGLLLDSIVVLAVGAQRPPAVLSGVPLYLVAAALAILVGWRVPAWRRGTAVAATWALTPPLLVWLVSLSRPAWHPKQIIVAAPGWELLLGLAVVGLVFTSWLTGGRASRPPRWEARVAVAVGLVMLLILVGLRLQVLHAMYFDPAYQRDDYRGLAAAIDARARAQDAVVLNAPTQVEVYGYYDRGRHTTYPLPLSRPPDRAATLQAVSDLLARQRDLYGVLWATEESDPQGLVVGELNERRYTASDTWFGGVRLVEWAAPRPMITDTLGSRSLRVGESLILHRLARPTGPATAGDFVTLEADWRAPRPPPVDYVVFVQLLAPDGRLVAQRDLAPEGGLGRTSTWADPAAVHTDRMALRLPDGLAPGEYTLILGLYDPATGERARVVSDDLSGGSDHVTVGTVRLVAPR